MDIAGNSLLVMHLYLLDFGEKENITKQNKHYFTLFHIISHKIWHKYFVQKCFDQTLGEGLKKWLLLAATTYHPDSFEIG